MKTFFQLRESLETVNEAAETTWEKDVGKGANSLVTMAKKNGLKAKATGNKVTITGDKKMITKTMLQMRYAYQAFSKGFKEEIEEATSPADLAKAMAAFKKRGGKVKKLAPGKAAGWHGKDDLGTDTHGMIAKNDTKKFKTKRGGKIKSMSADTQYDENYQVQKYTNGKKDGAPKSFGGNLKKATAHADKMGGDHRVHKVK